MALKRPITELDFFKAKEQLKTFLKEQDRFKDYDFEGSNMSVLLDVLAYNTYQNNFYANMSISEMFLDSAQRENSVISHAKELNYLPRSNRSSMAVVELSIINTETSNNSIFIPKNTRFTSTYSGETYSFYTNKSYIANRITGTNKFSIDCVEIYEGELLEESFFLGTTGRILLSNENIDTSSIAVFVGYTDSSDPGDEFIYTKDIFGINETSNVFYVQKGLDSKYEIYFGENRFGRQPTVNEEIRVSYRIASGLETNGASRFSCSIPNTTVTVKNVATGGSDAETIDDIKFFAPKSIQIQERAVTERDYEVLLKQAFNEIKDISVFGGDELDPPRFGKVAIAVSLEDGGLTQSLTNNFELFLRDKTPVSIQPVFVKPDFMYINAEINVNYSRNLTSKSASQLEQEIRDLLKEYNNAELQRFGATFEVSRVSTMIDNLDVSIINNTIGAIPFIIYSPEPNSIQNPRFNFATPLQTPCRFSQSQGTESFNKYVRSSEFILDGVRTIFEDNGLGQINILAARDRNKGVFEIVKRNAGVVDYSTGEVRLSDFSVDSYSPPGISVFVSTLNKNVTSPKRSVLRLRDSDITINMIAK